MPIEFGPLPPRARGHGGGHPEAPWRAELRGRPGEWAVVRQLASAEKVRSVIGSYSKMPGYEFAQRRQPDGSVWLYARYVGVTLPSERPR